MSKWILNISLSAVSANSRAMWIIGLAPLFLLSSYPCIEIEGTIEKIHLFIHSTNIKQLCHKHSCWALF